jgi:hypothetical protein
VEEVDGARKRKNFMSHSPAIPVLPLTALHPERKQNFSAPQTAESEQVNTSFRPTKNYSHRPQDSGKNIL